MTEVGVVIVAAGRGERLGHPEGKARVPLLGRPLLAWSLLAFDDFHQIRERVVVVPPGQEDLFREEVIAPLDLERDVEVVAGGEERQDSVANGLDALTGSEYPLRALAAIAVAARRYADALPLLDAAAPRCAEDGVRILAVDVGEDEQTVTAFLERHGLTLPVLR